MAGNASTAALLEQVRIGAVVAACRRCGGVYFTAAGPLAAAWVRSCAACGTQSAREDLVQQVRDAVARSAQITLDGARAARIAAAKGPAL